jgi:hypothetical protein
MLHFFVSPAERAWRAMLIDRLGERENKALSMPRRVDKRAGAAAL